MYNEARWTVSFLTLGMWEGKGMCTHSGVHTARENRRCQGRTRAAPGVKNGVNHTSEG